MTTTTTYLKRLTSKKKKNHVYSGINYYIRQSRLYKQNYDSFLPKEVVILLKKNKTVTTQYEDYF